MVEGHVAAWVDMRHEHGAAPFPSRLRVPRAVQGLPRVSISKATHVKWESNCPVGSTRAAGRRCCTPCLRLWLRLGLSMGELPDVRWCAVVCGGSRRSEG